MDKLIIKVHNTETNQIIEREMTSDELQIFEIRKIEIAELKAEAEAKAAAKAALLAQLGITEEQAKLLLS